MKRSLYIVALTTGLAQAASTSGALPIERHIATEEIPTSLPQEIITDREVLSIMPSSVASRLKSSLKAKGSDVYQAFETIVQTGYEPLCKEPAVVAQAALYRKTVRENHEVQKFWRQFENFPGSEPVVTKLIKAYQAELYKQVEVAVPGFKYCGNLENTIKQNTHVTLDETQKVSLVAAEYAMGLFAQDLKKVKPQPTVVASFRVSSSGKY